MRAGVFPDSGLGLSEQVVQAFAQQVVAVHIQGYPDLVLLAGQRLTILKPVEDLAPVNRLDQNCPDG